MFGPMQHVYVTMHGEWTYPAWLGETAQMGLRMALANKLDLPAPGSIFTIPINGDVVTDTGSQAGTHGTLSKSWDARIGGTGSIENFNAGQQIDVAEDCWTFLNTIKPQVVQGFRFTHVKIAPIEASGAYGAGAATYSFTTPLVGTAATTYPPAPPEVAVAASMRAPIIGRRGRGRIFIPGVYSASADADGTLQNAPADVYRDALVTLIGNLENLSGTSDYEGVVMVTSAGKADAVRPTEVRVGKHFDVQRRRQAQAAEVYRVATL